MTWFGTGHHVQTSRPLSSSSHSSQMNSFLLTFFSTAMHWGKTEWQGIAVKEIEVAAWSKPLVQLHHTSIELSILQAIKNHLQSNPTIWNIKIMKYKYTSEYTRCLKRIVWRWCLHTLLVYKSCLLQEHSSLLLHMKNRT